LGLGRRELKHPGTLTVDSFGVSKRQLYALYFSIIFIGDYPDISLGGRIKSPYKIHALVREMRIWREVNVRYHHVSMCS
jgi:hypothetical protein